MKELLLWVLPNNGYDTVPAVREHLSAFCREHPGLRVSVWVRTQDSMWRRLFELLKDPQLRPRPDVVQIPSQWTSSLADLKLLKELGEPGPAPDLGRWLPGLRDHCRHLDKPQVYSLPWFLELRVLYYRREVLRRHGIDPETALATWDGLREACRTLAKRRRHGAPEFPLANPNPKESVSMLDLAPCVWARGGDFFSLDGSRAIFQREDACRGIADYFDLLASGWMSLKGSAGLPPKGFFEGGSAMQFSGRLPPAAPARPGGRGAARAEAGELRAVPIPGGEGAALLNAQSLAILSGTESPREAEALLQHLVDPETAAGYARGLGVFPATESGFRGAFEGFPELRPVFEGALAKARLLPNLRTLGTLEQVFDRSMERLVSGVVAKTYSPDSLRSELIHAGAEVDYIMSLTQR
ncbi:MAG TPA: hypothetical protein DD417_15990 [Elusimicrobia bacterium]|nr:hypothetical protein [Elusimicrobiota bacterium]